MILKTVGIRTITGSRGLTPPRPPPCQYGAGLEKSGREWGQWVLLLSLGVCLWGVKDVEVSRVNVEENCFLSGRVSEELGLQLRSFVPGGSSFLGKGGAGHEEEGGSRGRGLRRAG